jgi:phenylalanyl-tRNA synthetase beta chain
MLVSWNWLQQYVRLSMPIEELEMRLMMSGLNHEGTERVGEDLAIDLEVASNRPDCLGHIGLAREVAVLWDLPLDVPAAKPSAGTARAADWATVEIECPELCQRYSARVIRGVTVGPSPQWLVDRLRTVGIATVNNVVDIGNYVLMECGQPLHCFDLAKLAERTIRVRQARPGEQFQAIDHRTYTLEPWMCVIADVTRPVAIAGVMGGAETEISSATTDLLIETARFDPLSIRTTARHLSLQSPSSYRFERGVDPEGVDWASRRCCELTLELAGGELAEGVVDVGTSPGPRQSVGLRYSQLRRILGIEIDRERVEAILTTLGNRLVRADGPRIEVIPPSWRADLTREIDLVEEVGRIHGYDKIPEDVGVPMVASHRSDKDRCVDRIRHALTAAGLSEAMTVSVVSAAWGEVPSPWSDAAALECRPAVLRGSDRLRKSVVPSLLGARRANEALSNRQIELFEIAKAYLPTAADRPHEEELLAICSGRDLRTVKGILEAILRRLGVTSQLETRPAEWALVDPQRSCQLRVGKTLLGYVGEVAAEELDRFDLRGPATVAEVRLGGLVDAAQLFAQNAPLSPYPAVTRDRNVVFDEAVTWSEVERIVRQCGGSYLEKVDYQETYRDAERLGQGKKSLLFGLTLRSHEGTLTREEADTICAEIDARLSKQLGGQLRG